MAAAPQKTGVPQSAGNPAESALAVGQVANSNQAADVAGDNPAAADEQLAKAWGFSVRRPKLSKEALIGVSCIVALLVLFGVVIAKNWKNRANVVAEGSTKTDKEVKPAGGTDAFSVETPVKKTNYQNVESDQETAKKESDDLSLDVGQTQTEPPPQRVARKTNDIELDQEQLSSPSFEEQPVARNSRKSRSVETELDLNQEEPPAKKSRVTVSQDIDLDNQPVQQEPPVRQQAVVQNEPNIDEPLTKTREPKRFEEPVVREQPREEQFKEPIRVNAGRVVQEDFEEVPQRPAKKPARLPKVDRFTEEKVAVASDVAERRVSPTTDLSAPQSGKKHHPLLKENEYLVEKGDNFCVISKKVYGSEKYYLALAAHNRDRVADPCRMYPGLIVVAPPRETLEQQHAALIPKPKVQMEAKEEKPHAAKKVTALPPGIFLDDKGNTWYRVGKGDTISEIAQDYLGRESRATQIVKLNQERLADPHKLQLGQELRLPNDASRVRIAGKEPAAR
jgi:nucleoid-associated protein YgaU